MELLGLLSGLDTYISLSRGGLDTCKQLCVGLYEAGTVNLQSVCSRFKTGEFASNTRKVERFFKNKRLNDFEPVRYIIDHLFADDEAVTLAIDRTEWSFGQTWHNLLCISVLYGKTAVPLMVFPLERKGSSDCKQRLELLDKVLSVIPIYKIEALLGDREFIGDVWLQGLKERHIPFVMRVRNNLTIAKEGFVGTIDALPIPQQPTFHGNVHIGTGQLQLSTLLSCGELVAVVSYNIKNPLDLYKQRWGIETGFKCLKSNGFHLEETHIRHPDRLKMLVQICALAMTLSFIAVRQNTQKTYKKKRIHTSFSL
jgi:hypothetical protein